MSKGNPPIGTVQCPFKGCELAAQVKRFRQRAKTESGRRKAGLLYGDCPRHGRFGFDGAREMQEYILQNATIDGVSEGSKCENASSAGERSSESEGERSNPQESAHRKQKTGAPASARERSHPPASAAKPAGDPKPMPAARGALDLLDW